MKEEKVNVKHRRLKYLEADFDINLPRFTNIKLIDFPLSIRRVIYVNYFSPIIGH